MNKEEIKNRILDVMEETLGLEKADMLENMEMNLYDEGMLDSLSSASLMAHLEEKFNVTIDLDEFDLNDMSSASALVNAMLKLISK